MVVRASPEGDVRVEIDGRPRLALAPIPGGTGFAVRSDPGDAPARLVPGPDHVGGWIALDGGDPAREQGRTTPLGGPGGGESTMILRDGRVYRLIARYGARSVLAVCGWETPGAFLEARFEDDAWTIETTVAGEAMGSDWTMLALLAAELTARGGGDRETSS